MKLKSPTNLLLLTIAVLAMYGCNKQTENSTTESTSTTTEEVAQLQFEERELEQESTNCKADTITCATVSIKYAEATAGPTPLQQSINRFVQQRIKQVMLDFNPDADTTVQGNAAAVLANSFLKLHQQYVEEVIPGSAIPTATAGWELDIDATPVYVSDDVVSMKIEVLHYAGGAHQNYYRILQSFSKSGELLSLYEIVTDTAKLKQLTEEKFRQVKEGIGNKPLSELGLFIEGNTLPLPQNAALTAEGLLLYYNPYEIGPWAFGDTELLLPYQQVSSIVAEKYRHKK